MPANKPISSIRITRELPIKWAARLNMEPLSSGLKKDRSLNIHELRPTCTIRKEIRNKPVNAITSFLPTAEVKNWDHFIVSEGVEKFDAKVSPDSQKSE
jgi:hypothetical protein